eukprot:TRINITY_DN1272_c0_g1_i1.p1 TRINITY_DN1272_c0_g1~~TRINITY_DN1272_c0_g1_i1.p1  ORF type:complete len:1576 (-),score=141.06 TRINITY_DN1272_c0_g1_i1:63-4790(-)
MQAKYFVIILVVLPIYFGAINCQALTQFQVSPNGGNLILGQNVVITWQPRSLCQSTQIFFCPGTQTQGCAVLATLPASATSFQWTTDRIDNGRIMIQYRVAILSGMRFRCGAPQNSPFSASFSIRCEPLIINQHPKNTSALVGSQAQFGTSVSGSRISYQWLFNGLSISGAHQSTYLIPAAQLSNGGQYSVRLLDACQASVTSNPATLRVCPPIVVRQFSPILRAEVGSPFTLQVDATGQDLQFTWRKEERILSRANSLNFANFQTEDFGQYSVIIEDDCGQHTELQVMLYNSPFAITANPPSETFLFVGDSIQLHVQVLKGDFNVAYQWFRNGVAISRATGPTFNVTNFSMTDDGTVYTVSVSADGHTLSSEPSIIRAQPAPVILSTLIEPVAVFPIQDVTFSVTAFGQRLQYEWFVDGNKQEDATGLTSIQLVASSVTLNATQVVVRVSNPNGFADSAPMLLLIKNQPIFVNDGPLEFFLLLNQTFTLDMTNMVVGDQISYRWFKNNNTIIQQNETTLNVELDPSIVPTLYRLEASNPSGVTVSPEIWIRPEPAPEIIGHSESPFFYFKDTSPMLYVNTTGQGVQYRWFRGSERMLLAESSELRLWPLGDQDNELVMRAEAYNINGFSSSVNITLQLEPAPVLVQQLPSPTSVFRNGTATLSVQAIGHGLEFKWRVVPDMQFNQSNEGTTSTIQIPNVVGRLQVSVMVRNPSGAETSNVAFVLLHNRPQFALEFPAIIPVVVNSTALFQGIAFGTGVTYTWSIGDTVAPNLSDYRFVLSNIGTQYNGTIVKVIASNPSGSVSTQSVLIVVTPPTLQSRLRPVYEVLLSANLLVNVESDGFNVSYEWRYNGTWLRNTTTGQLEIDEVHFGHNGLYQLYLHNLAGTTGPYQFHVLVVQLNVRSLNSTFIHAFEGDTIVLGVTLSTQNQDILDIRWFLEDEQIEGASGTSLTLSNVSSSLKGHYEIYIGHNRNRGSYVKRSVATLVLLGDPVLQQPIYPQPTFPIKAGNNVTLSAIASPEERMRYQWYRNGEPIEGETGRTLSFEAEFAMNGDRISIQLTNPANSITGGEVRLNIGFSDTAIALIAVFVGSAVIASIIVAVIFVRRKINQRRQISFNKATYGIDDVKYPLLPPWVAPIESKLCTRLDLLPVTFSKTSLTFGGETRFNVNEEYTDTIEVKWQGGLKLAISTLHQTNKRTSKRTDLNIPLIDAAQKDRNLTVIFHLPKTPKLSLTAHPDEVALDYRWRISRPSVFDASSTDDSVLFKLKLAVSTSVTALIGVELPEIGKHFYIPCDIVANPSVWIDVDQIELDPAPIGEGSYGVVYKGVYNKQTVAVKKLKSQEGFVDDTTLAEFEREIDFLSKLRYPGIVSLIGASKLPGVYAIVTEYIANGSLETWMSKKLPYVIKLRIALEVAKAIDYLHENNVLHRDIKPANVLVESMDVNSPNMIRLSDFGSARSFTEDKLEKFTKAVGTPIYMAPEVLQNKFYDQNADVYSYGVLLWAIITQKEPYMAFTHLWDSTKFVLDGHREAIPAGCPADYAELITGCWCQDPKQRLVMKTVIERLEVMSERELRNVN